MASFDENSAEQLDFGLFQNGWITQYYKRELLELHCTWLRAHGYNLHIMDCVEWDSKETALISIAEQLKFPNYFGRNLDALNDCLRDLEVPAEAGGVAIIFLRYDTFASKVPELAHTILNIFAGRARHFMLFGQRLAPIIQSDNPNLTFPPVGGERPIRNRTEWLNANRG